MIFQHTIDKVLSGEKTQTRRLHTPGKQAGSYSDGRYWAVYGKMGNRPLWEVDHTYAVQPGRGKYGIYYRCLPDGKRQVWHTHNQGVPTFLATDDEWKSYRPLRIRITDIRQEDVREISADDLAAEGFRSPTEAKFDFLSVWVEMHDKSFHFEFNPALVDYVWYTGKRPTLTGKQWGNICGWDTLLGVINERPAERYQAWVLTFELVKP